MPGAVRKPSRLSRLFWIVGVPLIVAGSAYGIASGYFHLTAARAATRAEAELRDGRIASARSSLEWVLWFHPRNSHANLALGKIEAADAATDKAIECFRIIPAGDDLHRSASFQLAKSLALDGQLTAAEAELEQYIGRYRPTQRVWDLYFRVLYLQSRTRDVVSLFERKFAANPDSLSDVRFLLKAEFVPQEPQETLGLLEIIHNRHPGDVNVQVALAIALNRVDEENRAEELLRDVLDRQPGHHRARIVLAQWLADRQEFESAEDVLWRSGGYPDPGDAAGIAADDRFWSVSSRLAERNAEAQRALQYIDRALQLRANDKQYLTQRAQILRQLSKKEEAAVAAQQSVEAGRAEHDLYLLALDLENRPVSVADCELAAQSYRKLGREERAELWDRLGQQIDRTRDFNSALEGTSTR